MLAHGVYVRDHHPVVGINVHGEEPVKCLGGFGLGEQHDYLRQHRRGEMALP